MTRRQLKLDVANELEPGTLFGPPAGTPREGPTPASERLEGRGARVFDLEGRECCPACGGPFHVRHGERGGYCERCDAMRVTAHRLGGVR